MKRFIYPLFSLLPFLFFACNKTNDVHPEISLIEPLQNKIFKFGDTLSIKLFCENCNLRPEVTLLSGSKIVALSKYVSTDKDGSLNYQIVLNDGNLESDEYTIRAIGYNGENSDVVFQDIYYIALEHKLIGISMISGVSSSTTISQLTFGNPVVQQVLGYKARLMTPNSRQKTIVSASANLGNLLGFNHLDLSQNYQLPNPSLPGLAQYEFLLSYDDLVYVFQNDGGIIAISENGFTQRSYNLPQNKIPVCTAMGENSLLVATREEVGQNFILHLLNPQNGFVLKQVSIPGLVISMCSVGNYFYHVVYQKSGVYYLAEYNAQANKFTTITSIGSKRANVIVSVGQEKSLIGMDDRVLVYNPQQTTMPFEVYGFGTTDLDFDPLNSDVYLAIGAQVLVGKIGGATTQVFNATDSVFKVELVYNY